MRRQTDDEKELRQWVETFLVFRVPFTIVGRHVDTPLGGRLVRWSLTLEGPYDEIPKVAI